jgi:hypothetical protein
MMRRKLSILAAAIPFLAVAACEPVTAPFDGSPQFQGTGQALEVTDADVTPSTNEANEANGWAHVLYVGNDIGQVTLKFVSTRSFWSCFEHRADDEPNTVTGDNPNQAITDGRWTQVCVNNNEITKTILAQQHVDVRMVYGGETDERFDWTRFYVPTTKEAKEMCKNDWQTMGFKNQGQCVRYVETGKDSRIGQ